MSINLDIHSKTEVLLEALPYIQRFKGSIFVVKFGGSFLDTDQARIGVSTDLAFLSAVGIHVVVVHGGGPAINKAMADAQIDPVWKNGLRVTNKDTIDIVERTLNDTINKSICENIELQGGSCISVKGQDVFVCKKHEPIIDGVSVDLGFVGSVTHVKREVIDAQLEPGKILVVSPLAKNTEGNLHNVNADTAAANIAHFIGARRLVYLCDVPGLLSDPKNPESLISTLKVGDVEGLKNDGTIGSGMLPKVESAVHALEEGVSRVHFIDGRLEHSILLEIFTDKGIGTEIVH